MLGVKNRAQKPLTISLKRSAASLGPYQMFSPKKRSKSSRYSNSVCVSPVAFLVKCVDAKPMLDRKRWFLNITVPVCNMKCQVQEVYQLTESLLELKNHRNQQRNQKTSYLPIAPAQNIQSCWN